MPVIGHVCASIGSLPTGQRARGYRRERIEGFRVAYPPGHGAHHVAHLHDPTGDAYVRDIAGVTVPPSGLHHTTDAGVPTSTLAPGGVAGARERLASDAAVPHASRPVDAAQGQIADS